MIGLPDPKSHRSPYPFYPTVSQFSSQILHSDPESLPVAAPRLSRWYSPNDAVWLMFRTFYSRAGNFQPEGLAELHEIHFLSGHLGTSFHPDSNAFITTALVGSSNWDFPTALTKVHLVAISGSNSPIKGHAAFSPPYSDNIPHQLMHVFPPV